MNLKLSARDLGIVCAALALALDQGSKLLLLYVFHFADMAPGQSVPVLPFFNLVMVWNPCISFGICIARGVLGTVLIVVFSLAVSIFLGWWLWGEQRKILAAGLGFIIGGALGNLIDRLIHTRVADFFHFYIAHHDWYVFNVADVTIDLGIAALLYDLLVHPKTEAGKTGG